MSDALLQADTDACADEAITLIEAVLAERYPEARIAFWSAVSRLYRLDSPSACQATASSPNSDAPPPTQT